jgi:UDP-N-acetylglucosamine 2-epimerase (non-hydrolysing)
MRRPRSARCASAAHPRTLAQLDQIDTADVVERAFPSGTATRPPHGRVTLLEPLGYLDFMRLTSSARLVLTDSGGVQDETTCFGVPCLSMRPNTERPVTTELGTNVIVGTEPANILASARSVLVGDRKPTTLPPLWDGHASERIVRVLQGRR